MVSFKGNSRLYTLACKNSLTIFLYILQFSMEIMSSRSQHAGEAVKRLCNYELQCYENPMKMSLKTQESIFQGPEYSYFLFMAYFQAIDFR